MSGPHVLLDHVSRDPLTLAPITAAFNIPIMSVCTTYSYMQFNGQVLLCLDNHFGEWRNGFMFKTEWLATSTDNTIIEPLYMLEFA